jgi:hypothetical protein
MRHHRPYCAGHHSCSLSSARSGEANSLALTAWPSAALLVLAQRDSASSSAVSKPFCSSCAGMQTRDVMAQPRCPRAAERTRLGLSSAVWTTATTASTPTLDPMSRPGPRRPPARARRRFSRGSGAVCDASVWLKASLQSGERSPGTRRTGCLLSAALSRLPRHNRLGVRAVPPEAAYADARFCAKSRPGSRLSRIAIVSGPPAMTLALRPTRQSELAGVEQRTSLVALPRSGKRACRRAARAQCR